MNERFGGLIPQKLRLIQAGVLAVTMALTGACTDGENEPPTNQPGIESIAPDGVLPEDWPSCKPAEDVGIEIAAAQRCLSAMSEGSVALVTIGIPADRAEAVAQNVESTLEQITGGLVRTQFEAVPASSDAEQAAVNAMPDNCVPERTFISQIADQTMPLSEHNFVVSLTSQRPCDFVMGRSAGTGRHADIFARNPLEGTLFSDTTMATTVVHEFIHTLQPGLVGHSGQAVTESYHRNEKSFEIPPARRFDLIEHATQVTYDESGADDVMGGREQVELNPVHLSNLSWPKEVLQGETASFDISEESVAFASDDMLAGHFGRISLRESVVVAARSPGAARGVFDTLYVVPMLSEDNPDHASAQLLLENSQNYNIAEVGVMDGADGSSWTIVVDSVVLATDIEGQSVFVRTENVG